MCQEEANQCLTLLEGCSLTILQILELKDQEFNLATETISTMTEFRETRLQDLFQVGNPDHLRVMLEMTDSRCILKGLSRIEARGGKKGGLTLKMLLMKRASSQKVQKAKILKTE